MRTAKIGPDLGLFPYLQILFGPLIKLYMAAVPYIPH